MSIGPVASDLRKSRMLVPIWRLGSRLSERFLLQPNHAFPGIFGVSMEQWEANNWRKKLELGVIKQVLVAVQSVAPEIEGVDFDLQNEAVIIHSTTVLTGDEWKRVQDIGMEKIQSIVPCTSPIRIRQLRRPTFAYTFHGPPDAMRKRVRKAEVTEFSLELSAINSLAEAYAELIKRSKDFDVVVGFALGGSACVKFCHRI